MSDVRLNAPDGATSVTWNGTAVTYCPGNIDRKVCQVTLPDPSVYPVFQTTVTDEHGWVDASVTCQGQQLIQDECPPWVSINDAASPNVQPIQNFRVEDVVAILAFGGAVFAFFIIMARRPIKRKDFYTARNFNRRYRGGL